MIASCIIVTLEVKESHTPKALNFSSLNINQSLFQQYIFQTELVRSKTLVRLVKYAIIKLQKQSNTTP